MRVLPSISDIIEIFLIIIATGFIIYGFSLASLTLTGYAAFLNTGYSMCVYEDPLLEVLPMNHDKCAWTPINILILNRNIDKYHLKVGDNVCYLKGKNDIVCHRIKEVKEQDGKIYYYIVGLHPRALKEWVSADRVFAVPIDKLPRGLGGSMLFAMFLFKDPIWKYLYINKGFYI